MIIYEVNIQVPTKIYQDYIKWLDIHILEMLKFEGFISNKKFLDKQKSNGGYIYICVHYYLDSIKSLDKYLENNAKNMRTITDDRFINNIKINRRVIHEI